MKNNKHGAIPFWFWNGEQNEKEITRQLELAFDGGIRGMAVHARKGNQIEYMSERWLELFRHTCIEARRIGLEIWLYDEEGCPSGTVGERLPAKDKRFQQKALKFFYTNASQACADKNLVRAFDANSLSEPIDPEKIPGDTKVLAFSKYYITDYIDALCTDCVDEFLKMTHDVYHRELGEFFGDPVTAIYTDDLNHLLIYGEDIPYLPYTEKLPEFFKNKNDYCILDNLPALVENIPGCEKVRFDYRRTVLEMFLDNYVKPMHKWCNVHGLPLTGHLSGDEGSMLQSISRFTSAMPFYEHEDIPGIDDFLACRQDIDYMGNAFNELGFSAIILCKQASSVASQLKNGLCSSEVLTSRGWGVPVELQMAQICFQQALGINVLIPHDFSYSTAGETKRDHPESYFFQQPYYKVNREIQKELSNSNCLLQRGICAAKTAVIHPISSGWIALDGERLAFDFSSQFKSQIPDTVYLEKQLAEISLELLQKHVDFEFIDEELLLAHGRVDKNEIVLGSKRYDTIILPPMINVYKNTIDLLRKLTANGGRVIQIGEQASFLDGEVNTNIFDFPVKNTLEIEPLLKFKSSNKVILHTRLVNGQLEYFLVNFSDRSQCLEITQDMRDYVLCNPQTGEHIEKNGTFPEVFCLPPAACCHIIKPENLPSDSNLKDISGSVFEFPEGERTVFDIDVVQVYREHDNILLIDAGILPNGKQILFSDTGKLPADTEITVYFDVHEFAKISYIYAEINELKSIEINDRSPEISSGVCHPASQDLPTANISGLITSGRNVLKITCSGKRIENMFLSGDFAVKLADNSAKLVKLNLTLGDASSLGLPFYWGSLRYCFEFEADLNFDNLILDLGKVGGVIEVYVNKQLLTVKFQSPWIIYLNDFVKRGSNQVEIILYNTAQNLFGPHRAKNIFGDQRPWEGSSEAAWTPELRGDNEDSWGVASFGIYGPVTIKKSRE